MGKYDKVAKELKIVKEFSEEQTKLHKKYKEIEDDKVIVEKSNTIKFLVKTGISFLKVFANIILCVLASIGMITLTAPILRVEFLRTISETLSPVREFFSIF